MENEPYIQGAEKLRPCVGLPLRPPEARWAGWTEGAAGEDVRAGLGQLRGCVRSPPLRAGGALWPEEG